MKAKRKKEKILKKSMREKKRYLLLGTANKEKVRKAILDYIGILGYGKTAPVFVKNKPLEKVSKDGITPLILAVNRKELERVKSSLLSAGISIKRVSGTLKGLRS